VTRLLTLSFGSRGPASLKGQMQMGMYTTLHHDK
jgi:hypothetical protein